MYTKWTSNLQDEKSKADFSRQVLGSKDVLDRLKQILEDESNSLNSDVLSEDMFDAPNWQFRQAFKNGQRSEVATLMKLIDLDQQETDIGSVRLT